MQFWQPIVQTEAVENIWQWSMEKPQLIFKHSTRCGISVQAQERLLAGTDILHPVFGLHYIDLLQYRPVSQYITDKSGVLHQSPQILLVSRGKVTYSSSHQAISPEKIKAQHS
jgi:bacillithiol system protein YtxJ